MPYLDAGRFVETILLHVHNLTSLTVDTPRVLAVSVLRLIGNSLSVQPFFKAEIDAPSAQSVPS